MKMNALFDLKDKTAIVTGGGNGIGKSCCEILAAHGASVVIADLKKEDAEKAATEIMQNGGKAAAVACDVTNDGDLVEVVSFTEKEFGKIHIPLFPFVGRRAEPISMR
jgi:7-alpha-hydroxysteroid dehydrogenase